LVRGKSSVNRKSNAKEDESAIDVGTLL
jgi:hypothetical protein